MSPWAFNMPIFDQKRLDEAMEAVWFRRILKNEQIVSRHKSKVVRILARIPLWERVKRIAFYF